MAGHPSFKPTDEQRADVSTMAALGFKYEDIRQIIVNPETGNPINKRTLMVAFKRELATAKILCNLEVGRTLYQRAVGQREIRLIHADGTEEVIQQEIEPCKGRAIFWAKTRMGWKEVDRHELSGPDGAPIETSSKVMVYIPDNGRDKTPAGAPGKLPIDTG